MSSVRQRISSVPHAIQADYAKSADHARQAENAYFAEQAHSAQHANQARQADKSGNARAFGGLELVQFTAQQQQWNLVYRGAAQSVPIGFKQGLWKIVCRWQSGESLVTDLYLAIASEYITSGSLNYQAGVLRVSDKITVTEVANELGTILENTSKGEIIAVYHLRHS